MDASTPMPADLQRQQDRKRKRKAILAGGVVLGLGAAVTLAAWSDDVFAGGEFETGQFNIQGSATTANDFSTADWADYNTSAGAAPLTFSTGFNAMAPGTTVYSPISLRIDPEKAANSADVRIVEASSNGDDNLAALLTYGARTGLTPSECAAGAAGGTEIIPAATSVDAVTSDAATFRLSNADAPATVAVTVCIAVTLPQQPVGIPSNHPDWTFDESVTTTWQFTGESVSTETD